MSGESAQERGTPNVRERPIWKTALMYGLLSATIMFVFGSKNVDTSAGRKSSPTSGRAAMTKENVEYAPFAQKDDSYTIVISSGDDDTFPEDTFSDLILGDDVREISRRYHVDLRRIVDENRSVVLSIKMRIKEKEYVQEFPLVRFLPSRRARRQRHLLTKGNAGETLTNSTDTQSISVWKAYFQPTLTLSPIIDFSTPLPPPMRPFYFLDNQTKKYLPLLYINNFWVLRDHLIELNATTVAKPLNFTITVSPCPLWKFALYVNFEQSMNQQMEMGLTKEGDSDETKRIFLETNPYFLGLTCVVTVLHMLFEYLAFSNDVKFWRHRKDFKGLSLRTIVMNCYFQTVVFLYLWDGDETSWTILLPNAFGVILEYWKLAQTAQVVRNENGWLQVKFNKGYDKRTRKHDDVAVRYLMYVMTPILLCYTAYSAIFDTHKGWYSFIISTQVRFIYMFGFAMLTPQIFINYKMKTVTQLPWRTFVYRALNTVIDDLFAFIIKMPWLHRLACFRDDVVFLILLYQRWIYPVDVKRKEGIHDEDDEEEEEEEEGDETKGEDKEVSLKEDKNADEPGNDGEGPLQRCAETKKKQ
ncbi:cleft lip and palate transmembrane 1 family protein [Trypanosoma grayi]|uniref:cleft lip and palate transmembrane 1 family protein n=1 Tax=Trypanosoma grayi TaxID=71804 RepID=UPI0004F49B58|nr:cleft lip and palate transmembrane 1 family protein [Trypanosoma grayi]KEG11466.1 cleft lip and palate transmembrane 1 family protein [Trypanosoma grayi]